MEEEHTAVVFKSFHVTTGREGLAGKASDIPVDRRKSGRVAFSNVCIEGLRMVVGTDGGLGVRVNVRGPEMVKGDAESLEGLNGGFDTAAVSGNT